MSVRQTYAAWRVKDLSLPEKCVLVALADYSDDNGGNIFPKIATLAEKTSASVITVKRCIKRLEELHHLKVVRGTGKEHSNYTLTLPYELLGKYDNLPAIKKRNGAKVEQAKIAESFLDQF